MKFNQNYTEGNCINLSSRGCGCGCGPQAMPFGAPNFGQCPQPMPDGFGECGGFAPCWPQQPQCNVPSCGYLNFQIPCSFLYAYFGYLIGNHCKN